MLREFLVVVVILKLATVCECKICPSVDIRNNVSNFKKLKDCTVVVGNLQVVLMTKKANNFTNVSFPELVEITGYLMIYSVNDLVSLGDLFPNLRVIRGERVFLDYSLIIDNVPHLKEIGLYNLRHIFNGFVRIGRVPQLCFVDTIDWKELGTELKFKNSNQDCSTCPKKCTTKKCWNLEHCQEPISETCHAECIGCDKPGSARHCHVCRNFYNDGVCVPKCPDNKLRNNETKVCMTKDECTSMLNSTWRIANQDCLRKCPIEYMETMEGGYKMCTYCGNKCPDKICPPSQDSGISSLGHLQQYYSCNVVNGSLEIFTRHISFERLEFYLKYIRVIKGSLKIGRTNVRSLEFLRNLQRIEGKGKPYAIFIYENNKLEKLWNFNDTNFNLKISKNSRIKFHNNPLLCYHEIEELARKINISFSDTDVSRHSNGDKSLVCSIVMLKVDIKLNSTSVHMSWKDTSSKNETNIGYTVNYMKSDNNTLMNDSLDNQCDVDGWTSIYTSVNELEIKELRPYTNYTYYIKVYRTKDISLQTKLDFFVTWADDPDWPRNITVEAINSSTIEITWLPPANINGELQYYQIVSHVENDNAYLRDQRDYCKHGRTKDGDYVDKTTSYMTLMDFPPQAEEKPLECDCLKKEKDQPVTTEVFFADKFCTGVNASKNACNPFVYNLNPSNYSDMTNLNHFEVEKRGSVKKSQHSKPPLEVQKKIDSFMIEKIPPWRTSHRIRNLKHFTLYSIYLTACNVNEQDPKRPKCGPVLYYFQRTLRNIDADNVEIEELEAKDNQVTLSWKEPSDPNGVISSYHIDYWYANKHVTLCVSRKQHELNNYKYTLTKLPPARYTISVRAISLAGEGRASKKEQFSIAKPSDLTLEICLIVIILTTCLLLGAFYLWYKKRHNVNNIHLITSVNPDYAGIVYVEDEWEIDRNDIEIYDDLGHGTFGQVYSGLIKSKNLCCAIKTVNDNVPVNGMRDFLNEALVMKSVNGCHHVVKLLGVVSRDIPPMVVMELMSRGDLKSYLRRSRESSQTITSNELYRMAAQIADGMAYLSAKKFVHRDLAARNCMVAEDRTVKVGDFGMTRDIYVNDYYRKETKGLLPVRWMAPESLHDGIFTSQSDVWSYGIVLWEMATLAEQPYQGMSNEEVLQYVIGRGRLERPQECPDLLYEIMRACWQYRPRDRPQFGDIIVKLEDHVGPDFKLLSYYFNRDGHDIHNTSKSEPTMYSHFDVNNDRVEFYHWQ